LPSQGQAYVHVPDPVGITRPPPPTWGGGGRVLAGADHVTRSPGQPPSTSTVSHEPPAAGTARDLTGKVQDSRALLAGQGNPVQYRPRYAAARRIATINH